MKCLRSEEVWGCVRANVNMSAWRFFSESRLIVVFLCYSHTFAFKEDVGEANSVCVSGSQVVHVNFGDGGISQCGLTNYMPDGHSARQNRDEKAKDHERRSHASTPYQGLHVRKMFKVAWCGSFIWFWLENWISWWNFEIHVRAHFTPSCIL